jgi:Protein of unknown function (DUF1566)
MRAGRKKTMWSLKLVTVLLVLAALVLATASCGSKQSSKTTAPTTSQTATSNSAYRVIATNQTTFYNDSTAISEVPTSGQAFYGQDAQYNGRQARPSYKDNGNGTVTDNGTGLMWQKDPGAKKTNAEAVQGASSCRTGGYSDWRLPTIKELYSLILFSGVDPSGVNGNGTSSQTPFIDTNYFDFQYGNTSAGERIIDAQYWSSTNYVSTTMGGARTTFGVNFADGRIKGYPTDMGPRGMPMTEFVCHVRGNNDYGKNSFSDNGDQTVTDKATGLTWSKGDSGKGMNWQEVLAWV